MSKLIAIFNQKGGVGKTTTNINLATCLATNKKRVLVIDIDPQGNTTSGLGIEKNKLDNTIYELLTDEKVNAKDVIIPTGIKNMDIIPSNVELAGAELELSAQYGREKRLKNALASVEDDYDYVLVDCPPSLGLLTINTLTAVGSVLIPIQCEFYALEGVSQLMSTIDLVKKNLNEDLKIEGVVLSMFDNRTKLSVEVQNEVRKYFKGLLYDTVIPRNVRLAEAPSHGIPIVHYDPSSAGAKAYKKFAKEFLKRVEKGE